MMNKKRMNSAQSILEHSVVTVCFIVALVAMGAYIKRGMQGKYKEVADSLGPQYSQQQSYFTNNIDFTSDTTTSTEVLKLETPKNEKEKYATTTTVTTDETQTQDGDENLFPGPERLFE